MADDDPMRSTFDAGAIEPLSTFDPRLSQQPEQSTPDASETQWLSMYNERLLLTVQAVNRLSEAFRAKML